MFLSQTHLQNSWYSTKHGNVSASHFYCLLPNGEQLSARKLQSYDNHCYVLFQLTHYKYASETASLTGFSSLFSIWSARHNLPNQHYLKEPVVQLIRYSFLLLHSDVASCLLCLTIAKLNSFYRGDSGECQGMKGWEFHFLLLLRMNSASYNCWWIVVLREFVNLQQAEGIKMDLLIFNGCYWATQMVHI